MVEEHLSSLIVQKMSTPRHLTRAPIREAVFDFRVKLRKGFDPRKFESLKPILIDRFPKMKEHKGGKVTFQLAPTGVQSPAMEDLGIVGFSFHSADDKLIAQFRVDGFTLNRLNPYTSWEELLPISLDLWKQYCSIASPETVTRLALRYINFIDSQADVVNLLVLLRAGPVVPQALPQIVGPFFSRMTVHDKENNLSAHIIQALEPEPSTHKETLIVDIDTFREATWNPEDPELLSCFKALHDFKNLIFFNMLTDEALRRFE